jgi:hypothetical protein
MDEPGRQEPDEKARLAALEEQVRQLTALVEQFRARKGRGAVRPPTKLKARSPGRTP